jgi:hypothetical protein
MQTDDSEDWKCEGWADQERGQLLAGAAMSFRERLLWLQEADRLVATLETQRAWIDKDGVVHAPLKPIKAGSA